MSYAVVIAVTTFASIMIEIYENISNYEELRARASYKCMIMVIRCNKEILISSDQLVPGDLVIVPQNCTLPCDIVLMSG